MRRLVIGTFLIGLAASTQAATTTLREVRVHKVSSGQALPADLASPEGKTRWELEALTPGAATTVLISREDQGVITETRRVGDAAAVRTVLSGADAERFLLPDHELAQMKMGAKAVLTFSETRDGLVDRLIAEVSTIGIGWLLLPDDPQEVVLQRVLVRRQRAGERAMRPELVIHRWVNPRVGIVATISGPASSDGRTRLAVGSVEFSQKAVASAATTKLYADQIYRGTYVDIKYGYDKGVGTLVSSLVPNPGMNNICDLVGLDTWNFSGVTTGSQTATIEAPINAVETCNSTKCGYANSPSGPGLGIPILERLDRDLVPIPPATPRHDNQVVQRENRATDVTFWLRAGTQNEGVPGAFGGGETRFCFTNELPKVRNEVPVWRMAHNDAGGWYTQAGDSWGSAELTTSACQEIFYTGACGSGATALARKCDNAGQTFHGSQFSKVVKGGVIQLPSGHTFNTVVVRNTTEFCTYALGCSDFFYNQAVRTIVYIWEAPFVGAVALVRGKQRVDFTPAEVSALAETPCTNFTTLDFTDISYGLLPPVSITAGIATDTTVALSWNPGNDTHRIAGYKIYWDTDPGASTAYAFNSVSNPSQVVIAGTNATISGLTPGTPYYFTVTSLSDFQEAPTLPVTRYESIRYPTTVSGDPNFAYPAEVTATTTGGGCTLQGVNGLRVDKALPNLHVCWVPPTDTCPVGWNVKTSDTPGAGGFGVVGQLGATNCWDGNPPPQSPLVFIQVGP